MAVAFEGNERFEVVRELGRGGMGVVFEVVDRDTERRCALKVLKKTSPNAILQFKREYRTVQGLTHPNLVRLGELLTDAERWFFTMELVRGVDLATWLENRADARTASPTLTWNEDVPVAMPSDEVGPITEVCDPVRLRAALVQLARGLCFLHDNGKVHRDVKPSNVLVDTEGRVVILDFGLAEHGTETAGTPAYMAPECIQGGFGPSADMYAVGVILFEALTGRHPFGDRTLRGLRRRRFLPVPRASRVAAGVPQDLDELCVRLLSLDARARPTAAETLAWLGDSETKTHEPFADFIGRDSELLRLTDAFTQSRRECVMVALKGPSGIGKTATLGAFLAHVSALPERPIVLTGRCHEHEGIPYKAVDAVMDELAQVLTEEDIGLPEDAELLGVLFPVLQRVPKIAEHPGGSIDVHELRRRAELACRMLLGTLARRRPVVIAIDDFQWSDADSRALLSGIARAPDAPPVLLLLSTRTEAELTHARLIELEPLPLSTSRALVEELLTRAGAPTTGAHEIAREAEGNPFFLHELVRSSTTRVTDGDSPSSLPRLERALLDRVSALESDTRRVLELVALAAAPTPERVLRDATQLDVEAFARIVHRLRAERFVLTTSTRDVHQLEMYHDRIREIVTRQLGADARQTGHLQLGHAIERRYPDELDRLVTHFEEGKDLERAGRYALAAGDRARSALAFERAAEFYRIAIARLAPASRRKSLQLDLAESLAGAGIGGAAAEAYLAAAAAADKMTALELRRRAAEHLLSSGRLDEGFVAITGVLEELGVRLPSTRPGALTSLLVHRARALFRGLDVVVRDPSEMAPAQRMRVDALWTASARLGGVDPIAAGNFQARHLLASLELGDHFRIVRALLLEVVFAAVERSRSVRHAQRVLSVARSEAARLDSRYTNALLSFAEGASLFQRGRFRPALAFFDRAAASFRTGSTGASHEVAISLRLATDSLFHLGKTAEMCRRVPHLLADAERRGDLYLAAELRTGTPNAVWLCADRPDEARRANEAGIAGWSDRVFFLQNYYHLLASTQISLYLGDGSAHEVVEASFGALEKSFLLQIPLIHMEAWHLRARAAIACRGNDAQRIVRQSLRELRASRLPLARGLGLAIRAGLAAREADLPTARRELAAAERAFAKADAGMYQRACRLVLSNGDESSEAARSMREESIQAPARFAAMLVPGFQ